MPSRLAALFSRRRALAALGLACALLATGCPKGEGDKQATHPSGSAAGTKVEFWTMQLKPTFEGYMTDLLAQWEKAHPGVDVEWVDLPASAIENKALTAAASGHAPDLINLNPSFANKLAGAGALAPLTLDAAFKAQYFDAGWEANTVNGQVVGLPWYLSSSVSLFNTALWQKAGLKANDWPHTYEALATASRTIKEKTGAYGFMPNFGDRGKFMEVLVQQGVPLLSADGKQAMFNGPEGVAALDFWVRLFKDKTIPQEALTQGHREALDRFQAGQTAVFPGGPQMLGLIQQNSPELYKQLAVGPQITGASGKLGIGVMNLVIPKGSSHQDLALDLAKFVTSGPNQLAFAKIVPILPSVKAAAADPYFKAGPGADLVTQARATAASQLPQGALLVPPLPHQSELSKSLDDALQRAALGQQTSAQALDQAAKEWNSILGS